MKNQNQTRKRSVPPLLRWQLADLMQEITQRCVNCPKCKAECKFLEKYGTPREIVENADLSDNHWLTLAYECSLCGLCGEVCPVGLRPEEMFLDMRREAVDRKAAPLPEHRGLLDYERRGTSRRFSYYSLPENCRTVFFPGCTLTGTRPQQTIAVYEHLKTTEPSLGIVLDCCCKPSHDLGCWAYFSAMNDEMKSFLAGHGVRTVVTACPNCHNVFKSYGDPFEVKTVYELMLERGVPESANVNNNAVVSIHDPCVTRSDEAIQKAVRKLAAQKGFTIVEMLHTREKTLCCGEGGGVGPVTPLFADAWAQRLQEESAGRILLTCCAGCADRLQKRVPTFHILDAVLDPQSVESGKVNVAGSPLTYFNRLRVKRYVKKQASGVVTRERTFSAHVPEKSKTRQRIFFLILLAVIIGVLNYAGGARFLEQAFLRQWLESWGVFAPILYILIYTIAPVLLLPGLPLTIAGGILFGPFWGVVYSITGATAGACASFLVARYLAGGLIRQRLSGPGWKRLDEGVARHGWKIVAFTRLIPVFPFNLLNYAFGLSTISFFPYAVASFVCMLPACIAFIVFSSSLPELIRGRITPAFAVGLVLIGAVSMLPVLYRYYRARKV